MQRAKVAQLEQSSNPASSTSQAVGALIFSRAKMGVMIGDTKIVTLNNTLLNCFYRMSESVRSRPKGAGQLEEHLR